MLTQNAVTVEAEYDDSDPISYAAVEVFSPTGKVCFQSGRTDKNGRFAFCPDENGEWKVIVDDEMGHKLVLKTDFDEKSMAGNQTRVLETGNAQPFSRFQGIVMGLSLIFGVFGLAAFLRNKKVR